MPSTSLRLSLEDVKPNPRIDLNNIMLPGATVGSPAPPPVIHKLPVEMQRHKNDVDDLIKSQHSDGVIRGSSCSDTELNPNMWSICVNPSRKRFCESAPLGNPNMSGSGVFPNTNYHHHTATTPSNMLFSQHSSATCMPSTGLHLSLEDMKPNPRIDLNNIMLPGATAGSPAPPLVSHKLAVEMQRHKNDVDDFIKSQNSTLQHYTGYELLDLKECICVIHDL